MHALLDLPDIFEELRELVVIDGRTGTLGPDEGFFFFGLAPELIVWRRCKGMRGLLAYAGGVGMFCICLCATAIDS